MLFCLLHRDKKAYQYSIMPRSTRDELFQSALSKFFWTELGERFSNHATNVANKHPFSEWTIDVVRGGRGKLHEYSVHIKKEITVGSIYQEGQEMPLTFEQYIPPIDTIRELFQEEFGPYEMFHEDTSICSTKIVDTVEDDVSVQLKIAVTYYKHFTPFFANTRINREMREMKEIIAQQQSEHEVFRKSMNHLHHILLAKTELMNTTMLFLSSLIASQTSCQTQMSRKMRELYAAVPALEECPVCKTNIEKDNLHIPPCAHFICVSCKDHCTSCPICRGPKH